MKTKIIKISAPFARGRVNHRRWQTKIKQVTKILQKGGIVAFPTETVYGLGASVWNKAAIKKIFRAKRRPPNNPLIVHISQFAQLKQLVTKLPPAAKRLVRHYWPGPLTIVCRATQRVPQEVTAGLPSVAVRMPRHQIALALIDAVGPIAAPSANISGRPSPTTVTHVHQDLTGKIDALIDAGSTKIGLESTVVDFTSHVPTLLRPGAITLEQLRKILGRVVIFDHRARTSQAPKSPGMKYKHYAPRARVVLVGGNQKKISATINHLIKTYQQKGKVGVICWRYHYKADYVYEAKNLTALAANLFNKFRSFDSYGVKYIIMEGMPERHLGLAIMNRAKKAATHRVQLK